MNLCHHHKDFGLNADWTFFATSHGKSPCDGVGRTVKRLVSRASLQRPINNQILTAESFFEFCQENISGISFDYLTTDSLVSTRVFLNERFLKGNTIPGTRSFHYFTPLDEAAIGCKFVSCDSEYSYTHRFFELSKLVQVFAMNYVACCYNFKWWIGIILSINEEWQDAEVKFLHPHGPAEKFFWPQDRDDICHVPFSQIICTINPPTPVTSGRSYVLAGGDNSKITTKFRLFNH